MVADQAAATPVDIGDRALLDASLDRPAIGDPMAVDREHVARAAADVEPAGVEPADLGHAVAARTASRPALRPRPALLPARTARPPDARAGGPAEPDLEHGATAPQLRRFIKSRAYVPMHELRRRFAINGDDDDVTPLEMERQRVYVGLPPREGKLLGELLKGGDIGVELSLDPIAPIVVGVYPMRPIPRS